MPEIEQRALSLLRLVGDDDARLGRAADRDRFGARRSAGEHVAPVRFQKLEKAAVANEPIFDDLGEAGAKIALAQRIEARGVGQHQRRLMKGADEILSVPRIDPRLAADAGIDLGEQRRRDLDQAHAPAQGCGAKSGEIADDAAAERDDDVSPLDARLDQRVADASELGIGLRGSRRAGRRSTSSANPPDPGLRVSRSR